MTHVDPGVIELSAPAGYGKTVLAKQIAAHFEDVAICDCMGLTSELDFSDRVWGALADGHPSRADALAQRRLAVDRRPDRIEANRAPLLKAWSRQTGRRLFIFENAESLAQLDTARSLFNLLVASRSEDRVLLVCTRQDVLVGSNRFTPPHALAKVGVNELAFDAVELGRIFGAGNKAMITRVSALTRGWPIAVLLLRRLGQTEGLARVLERLDRLDWSDVYDYLSGEVVAGLSVEQKDTLIACASIPRAQPADVALARGVDVDSVVRIASTLPFITAADDVFEVHPLMQQLLQQAHPERRLELLGAAAVGWQSAPNPARAAECYLEMGDQDRAATELAPFIHYVDPNLIAKSASIVARIDEDVVLRHPTVWMTLETYRRYRLAPSVLIADSRRLLERGRSGISRVFALVVICNCFIEAGEIENARHALEELLEVYALPGEIRDMTDSVVVYTWGHLQGAYGRTSILEDVIARLEPLHRTTPALWSILEIMRGAYVERIRGERERERTAFANALEAARGNAPLNHIAYPLIQAAVGAWIAGEDVELTRILSDPIGFDDLAGGSFIAAALGGREVSESALEAIPFPELRAFAALALAANARDDERRRALASYAAQVASEAAYGYVRVLALVALSRVAVEHAAHWAVLALEAVSAIEAPQLQRSVRDIVDGGSNHGALEAFVRRFERPGDGQPIRVLLSDCTATLGGQPVRLTGRELQLLFAIARNPNGCRRSELIAALWPTLDEKPGIDAFNTNLHRLRRRFAPQGLVERAGARYRLRASVEVDLTAIESTVRSGGELDGRGRAFLSSAFRRICEGDRSAAERWGWFEAIESRIRAAGRAIAARLADDALQRGLPGAALEFARYLTSTDELDEAARARVIRAHLALANRLEAEREYKSYERILRETLNGEPSAELALLLVKS